MSPFFSGILEYRKELEKLKSVWQNILSPKNIIFYTSLLFISILVIDLYVLFMFILFINIYCSVNLNTFIFFKIII